MFILLILLVIIILLIYVTMKWRISYWKRKGISYIEPELFYGNSRELMARKISTGKLFQRFYEYFKGQGLKHAGVYLGPTPVYIPLDPYLVKNILQTDFNYFVNRGMYFDEKIDPLGAHLFNLEDDKWKTLRKKLTPAFTSGQIKTMFPTVIDCTSGLKSVLDEHAKLHTPIDIKEALARFTIDVIGSVAFGIECNTIQNPDSDFLKYSRKVLCLRKRSYKRILEILFSRNLLAKIGVKFKSTPPDIEEFFMSVVRETVGYRESFNVYRKDLLHLLIQLKNRGIITEDENIFNESKSKGNYLTIDQVAAQCYVFFIAGYETSATTMTFALLELALNPHIQDKLRKSILTVLDKYNGELSYEAVMEMDYLDKVIYESLRLHPPLPFLPRKASKDYKVPDTNFTIEAGTLVWIPAQAIHLDAEYYPDPNKFDPERFSKENRRKRPPMTFLSFGEGPRNCIGLRFGLLQSKIGLITVLKNFKVTVNDKTIMPIEYDTGTHVTTIKGDLWLNLTEIV